MPLRDSDLTEPPVEITMFFADVSTIATDATLTEALIALVALTAMELVLGIDNIVFIAILTSKLPVEQQKFARRLGIGLAVGIRVLLLCFISVILGMVEPIFYLSQLGLDSLPALGDYISKHKEMDGISIRDLILLSGGLFLVWKSVKEIHEKMEGEDEHNVKVSSFAGVIFQILLLDVIFSLDSIITAVGMVDPSLLWVMITAIILSALCMIAFSEPVSRFVQENPTLKMLALSFLILIGVMLTAEGAGSHIEKGYIYFAMAFALLVEFLNMRMRKKSETKVVA
jgi:predicted tellurium resistance membrane protein TerC